MSLQKIEVIKYIVHFVAGTQDKSTISYISKLLGFVYQYLFIRFKKIYIYIGYIGVPYCIDL